MKPIIRTLLCGVVVLGFGSVTAAGLVDLLPAETFAAFGVEGLADHEAKAQPFIDEWQRLGLSQLLEDAYGGEMEEATDDIPEALRHVDLLDIIGGELWLGLSASSFNPLPAVTFVVTLNAAGQAAVDELLADVADESGVMSLTEGALTFYVASDVDNEDSELVPAEFGTLAWARTGDMLAVSSNPDVLRGVLRRYQGAAEPNLTSNSAFAATVGTLGSGNVYAFLDTAAVVGVVAPLAAGLGFDGIVQRLGNAFTTMGTYGAVSSIVADGIDGRSLRLLGDRSLDPRLYDLIAASGGVSDGAQAFVPATALGFHVASLDIPGWWAWLSDVAASEPQLGIDDLGAMVTQMTGLDLDQVLFSWMGTEVATITAGAPATTQVGMAMENPLGDVLYLVKTTDEAAAAAGINTLFQMGTAMASSFMDPMGESTGNPPVTRTVAGISVTDYELSAGFTISTAVAGGYAIIATTPEGMDQALAALAQPQALPLSLAPLRQRVPAGVGSFTLSDDRASLASMADTVMAQMGTLTGLVGSDDIDFDAAERANQALAQFIGFVADRLGASVSYTRFDAGAVHGESHSGVTW